MNDNGHVFEWTVLMPTFNGIRHVGAALASIRRQTVQPLEVLVVDAGSTDGTIEYLHRIAGEFHSLKVIQPGGRLTAPQARNAGLTEVRTPLLASLDQDDLMAPDRLENQADLLASDEALTIVGGRLQTINNAGIVIGRDDDRADPSGESCPPWPTTALQLRWAVLRFCPAMSSSQAFRTEALRAIGGFDEAHPLSDDYALLAGIVMQGQARCTDSVVGGYRRHWDMTSSVRRRRQFRETQAFQWRLIRERLGYTPTLDEVRAFVRPTRKFAPETLRRGRELAHELLAETHALPGLPDADREWIQLDFDRRLVLFDEAMSAAESSR